MNNYYDQFSNNPNFNGGFGEIERPDNCCNKTRINLSIFIGLMPYERWNNFPAQCCNRDWICRYPRHQSHCGRCWDFFDF